jgi:formylglycine-generating enzyme required for sulfatase activity
MVLLLALAPSLVWGQGGTGRENTNVNANKKAPPKPKTTARKPAKTTPSTAPANANKSKPDESAKPAFHPTNPGIELVKIPPGSFMMGSTNWPNEKPVHQVTINYSFYMGKYEVTQTQWQAVMGDNPSHFTECGNCPVDSVSWNKAQEFILRLNQISDGYSYRLPTEAEWEYACHAGTTGNYTTDLLKEMAWYDENSGGKTHAVGAKMLNAWGLADIYGNVYEWCQDWYHETYYGAPADGSAWLNGGEQKNRVMRGSGLYTPGSNMSSTNRGQYSLTDSVYHDIGFRVVAIARTQ